MFIGQARWLAFFHYSKCMWCAYKKLVMTSACFCRLRLEERLGSMYSIIPLIQHSHYIVSYSNQWNICFTSSFESNVLHISHAWKEQRNSYYITNLYQNIGYRLFGNSCWWREVANKKESNKIMSWAVCGLKLIRLWYKSYIILLFCQPYNHIFNHETLIHFFLSTTLIHFNNVFWNIT